MTAGLVHAQEATSPDPTQVPAGFADAPLSAIDWLNELEATAPLAQPLGIDDEAPITQSGLPPAITSTDLSPTEGRAIGVLSPAVTGLPQTLWLGSEARKTVDLLRALPDRLLPAQQDLRLRLLLAQATAPAGMETELFLQERAVALARTGRVAEAQALLAQLDPMGPDSFADFAAFSLLIDADDVVCERAAALAPDTVDFDLRVFCLARGGDWSAAAVLVQTAAVLGDITPDKALLLAQFLDPELADGALPSGPLAERSPLAFRLREAIGAPVTTIDLPLPYAVTDLRPQVAWKAQLDAAERLAAAGAVAPNQLLGLYTQRVPAASGGVWDRVAAIKALDAAIASDDAGQIVATAEAAVMALSPLGLVVPLAEMFAPAFATSAAASDPVVAQLLLLSSQYEMARSVGLSGGLAKGDTGNLPAPAELLEFALHQAFRAPPSAYQGTSLGADILAAIAQIEVARQGDPRNLAAALRTLRSVGLEDIARRSALQLLLLG